MENLTFWKKCFCLVYAVLWVGFSGQTFGADKFSPPHQGMDPVIFTFGCIDGVPGDTVCIPVTVQNFTDISIFQYEIIWDSDVLHFIDIQNIGSPWINESADFNLSGPNALKVIPLNFPPFDGETLPDGAVIFEVCFRIIGIPGSSSPVGISPHFDFEIANLNGVIPGDSVNCVMMVNDAIDLVGFVTSCGPAIVGGNGDIDVTVYGGTTPYMVNWLNTGSGMTGGPIVIPTEGGNMFLNVPAGNYDVIISDATGASVTYNTNVDTLLLSVMTRLRHPTCYKFDNGTMGIKPVGGSQPYSYIWESLTNPLIAGSGFIRDLGDSSLVTSLPDGTYRILVKDNNGCESEVTVVLNDNSFVFTIEDYQDATCEGVEDGFIALLVSGGTPDASLNYTITVKPGFVVSTNSVTIFHDPGDYCITVQDEVSQCDTIYCFTIGASTTISANVTAFDVPCAGGNDGSVTVSGLTNGVPVAQYNYSIYNDLDMLETNATNISGAFNYSPLAAGDYYVLVTDGACLSDTIRFTISEPEPILITLAGSTVDDCLPVIATGSVWFEIMNGEWPYILDVGPGQQIGDTITDLNAGNYVVTVTDANGCTATLAFRIYDGDDNEEADMSFQIDGLPCEGGTVTLLYQGGPIPANSSVSWSNGMTGPTVMVTGPGTIFVDLFIPGIHCMLNDTVIINCVEKLTLDVTVIQPACNSAAVGGPYTGTVIVDTMGAVAPVTFHWSIPDVTSTGTYTGLAPGIYYVTVTDALDSMAIDTFEIIEPPAINYAFGMSDSTSCDGTCDGAVFITATGGDPNMDYILYWTNNTPQSDNGVFFFVEDLCEGITEFSISQDGICFFENEFEIFSPEPVEIDLVNSLDVTCYGFSDGMIEVVASNGTPGYTYTWSGGPSSPIYSGIPEGEYFVTATDSEDCITTDSFTISQPDSLIASIDLSGTRNLSCGGINDGVVTVNVSGGNAGIYTFEWNPDVSTINEAINLAAGDYLITATDSKGCTDTTSYTLTSPVPIIVEWPDVAPPACFGDETLLQIDNVTGGTGNYNFTINAGLTLQLGEPILIPSGVYVINVTDDGGCSADSTYVIMEPNPILVSIGPDDPIIDLGDSLFLIGHVDQSDNLIAMTNWTAEVPVGCPTCEGTWVYNFLPTLYTWTVTDVLGCQGSTSIMVGVDFERDVFIPNVFTPNNDGHNEDFKIYSGPGVESINYFHVYDRWGNLVHSETNLVPNSAGAGKWDGTFNGEALSPGVYVYVAEVQFIDNATTLTFRGDITLIK